MSLLSTIISRGVAASRPAAGSVPVGSLYYSTDTGAVERNNGSSWDAYHLNPLTTQDDLVVAGASGVPARLAKGSDGQVLTVDPSTHHLVWATPSSGFANPMTTAGDLIVGDTGGAPIRKAKGADSTVLTIDPATHLPVWAAPVGGGGQELGYAQIATTDITTSATSLTDLTGATLTVTIGSRPVRVTVYAYGVDTSATLDLRVEFSLVDVTAGAEVHGAHIDGGVGTALHLAARLNPSAGSRQYKVQWRNIQAGTARFRATSTRPSYIMVEEV